MMKSRRMSPVRKRTFGTIALRLVLEDSIAAVGEVVELVTD